MRLYALLVASIMLYATESKAQEKKHFHIAPVGEQEKVSLNVNASTVNCRINSTFNTHVVSVYGYPTSAGFNPVAQSEVESGIRNVTLDFEDGTPKDLSSSLSAHVFGGFAANNTGPEKPWYIYLSRSVSYDLSLHYGMGSSMVDLSGLAVENLKVNTGSANIRIGYAANTPNEVAMDTLYTKVDLGVLQLDQINLSRAKDIIADVGFGKLTMNFSDDIIQTSRVQASIGAGSLTVIFPETENPVIVRLNNSPLCRITMPKSFRKIQNNTFINKYYSQDAANLTSFDIDVSVGNVEFMMAE